MALLNDPTGKIMTTQPQAQPQTAINYAEGPNRPPTYYTPGYDPRLPGTTGGVQYNPSLGYLQGQNGTGLGQYPITNAGPSNFNGPPVNTQYDRNGHYIGPPSQAIQNPNAPPVMGGPQPGKSGAFQLNPPPSNPTAPPPPTGTTSTPTSTTPPTKPILPGWGYYLGADSGQGQFAAENVNNEFGQNFLRQLQQYDPNAHFTRHETYGGEGGGGGETYSLDYDRTKLPNGGPGKDWGVDMNQGAFAGLRNDPNASYAGHLFNNDAVRTDPNGYGQVTDHRNQNILADQAPDWIGKYGPAIIAMIASMGAAAPALLAGEGMGSFGLGAGGNMAMGIVNGAQSLSNGGSPLQVLGNAAINYGTGQLGLPSVAKPFLQYGLNELTRKPDPSRPGGG
jgi:hypothetical protein